MQAYLTTMVIMGIIGFALSMWILGDFQNRYTERTQGAYAFGAFIGAGFTVWAMLLLFGVIK